MNILILLVSLFGAAVAAENGYENYKVYRAIPHGADQVQALKDLRNNDSLDFWSKLEHDSRPIDIMVGPEEEDSLVKYLQKYSIEYRVLINDVQEVVKKEKSRQSLVPRSKLGKIDFTRYPSHNEINGYLNQLAQDHSDLVTLETIGKSYEGRELIVIKISSNSSANNPIIFIDAGIHAREWIAPPVAVYTIQQLVENKANHDLLDNVDWHILPIVNPDGYEYTQESEKHRFWRKTRQPISTFCIGADANRNFGYHWAEVGSSDKACSIIYHGKHAFSEPETLAVRDYLLKNKDRIKLYLTLHSYAQLLVYPWSYTSEPAEDHELLQHVGELIAEAIKKVAGTKYEVGASTSFLGDTAGSSDDYAKGGAGIALSYTVELPGGGENGFDLPADRILSVVTETFEGFRAAGNYIAQNYKSK